MCQKHTKHWEHKYEGNRVPVPKESESGTVDNNPVDGTHCDKCSIAGMHQPLWKSGGKNNFFSCEVKEVEFIQGKLGE